MLNHSTQTLRRPTTRRRRSSVAIVVAIGLIAAACSSDDSESAPTADSAPSTEAAPVTESPTTEPAATTPPTDVAATTTVAAPDCATPVENTATQTPGVVADLADDESGYIEGVVVDASGNVFVSLIRSGAVLKFSPGSGEPEMFGQIPGWVDDGIGLLGLAADADGNIYGAAASETSAGIWKFDCVTGEATRFAGTEEMVFADGIVVDEAGVIWATDADSGADGDVGTGSIWRVDTDGTAEKWFEDTALGAPDPASELPGANGIAVSNGTLYVVNTAQFKLLSITIEPDGSAGEVKELADVFSPDGVALDADDVAYVTGVGTNEITRISPDGTIERVAAGPGADLLCPASAFFGTGGTERTLYVANLLSVGCGGIGPDLVAIDVDTAAFEPVAPAGESGAVFVVGDAAAPDPLDTFLVGVAGGAGVDLTLLDDAETQTDEGRAILRSASMIIVSDSVNPADVSPGLADLPVPLVNFSAELSVELGLATEAGEAPSGESFIVMNPETADHPLAAGLVGDAEVFSSPVATVNSGTVGGDVILIASTPGSPSLPTQYAYEDGATMADGSVAPARRIGGFTTLDNLNVVSGGAATLFFAMIDWLQAGS